MELREILWRFKKPMRTAQSYFPFLKETKDSFYRSYRRILRKPSEPYFAGLAPISETFPGSYIDVGGNTGQSIESIRLFVPDARIISFEPNPGLAAKLIQRYQGDPLVTIRDVGLSDQRSRMKLHVPSYRGFVYDGLGSLDYNNAKSWLCSDTVYFFDPNKLAVQSHDCAIETLDMQNIENPVFIKIDVEGTEFSVLKGGTETLRRSKPILLIEGLHEKPEIENLVRPLGYAPYEFRRGLFFAGYSPGCTFLITRERIVAMQGD